MRRVIEKEEGFTDGEIVERWSRKRVLIASIVLLLLLAGGVYAMTKVKNKATQVLGIESAPKITSSSAASKNVRLPTQQDAEQLLEQAKQEINNLASQNLSASQAGGLQKVVEDLQNIKSGSGSALGTFCDLVCKK